MADEPLQEVKELVNEFIAEHDFVLGAAEPASEAEISATLKELGDQVDAALPAGTELERALAKADAWEYFVAELVRLRGRS